MKKDERYIIEGWHYRMLVLDLYLLFVENVSMARKLSAAKSQKDFIRLQKQAERYEKRAYRKMRGWGIPKDCESFATETLQKAITKKYLTPLPDTVEETEI